MKSLLRAAVPAILLCLPGAGSPAQQDTTSIGRTATSDTVYPVPFKVGEKTNYEVHFGFIRVGSGSMEVLGVDSVRGRDAWHTRLRVKGGLPLARVDDLFESWIDVSTFNSLRFVQDLNELGKDRDRRFEIFPERQTFQEGSKPEQASVAAPLDDGSFLYFVRTVPLEVGQTYSFERYFRPDRNPVTIKVLRKETIKVPAGTYNTIVLQPIIRTTKLFADGGQAQIWLSDDDQRIMVQMKTKLSFGSLNLYLTSHRAGKSESR